MERIKCDALLIGSSSMDFWYTYSIDLPELRVVNTGKGGTKSYDWLEKYDEKVAPYAADTVVCYLGGNDINKGKTPEETTANMEELFLRIKRDNPNATLFYVLVNPASRYTDTDGNLNENGLTMEEFNDRMVNMCQRYSDFIKIIDMREKLLAEKYKINTELYRADGMHLNIEGYKIWTEVIRKAISL